MKQPYILPFSALFFAGMMPLQAMAGAPGQEDEGGYSLESAAAYTRQLEQNRNQHNHHDHHATHASHGAQGDHGGIHFSFKLMQGEMRGSKIGKDDASDAQILSVANSNGGMFSQLRIVPQEMTTTKYMFGAMTRLSGGSHLMLMVPYVEKKMKLRTYNAGSMPIGNFETNTSGMGDIAISLAKRLDNPSAGQWVLGGKISLPTGSIKESDRTYAPTGMWMHSRLPYAMQLGTGTVDVTPNLKGSFKAGDWQLLTGFSFTTRLGRNAQGYTYGDEVNLSMGVARAFDDIKTSLVLDMKSVGRINGKDDLISAPVQSAQTGFYGGQRATLTADVKIGKTFGAFVSVPVYEDLNGPQMSLDNMFGFSAKLSF